MSRLSAAEALDELEGAYQAALSAANRSDEYADLGGEGPHRGAVRQLRRQLYRMAREVGAVVHHTHEWTRDDRCAICGADGRA